MTAVPKEAEAGLVTPMAPVAVTCALAWAAKRAAAERAMVVNILIVGIGVFIESRK